MIRIFIDRPVLSSSILVLIFLGGVVGLINLPLNQYPEITPPLVSVSASLPGASADVAKQSIATLLEQQLNGTPRMQYMESGCTNTGGATITITFDADADPDIAAVDVQNRVKLAESRLPLEVVENGINVEKKAAFLLMFIAVYSDRPEHDYAYISNFSTINILDFLKRVPGVGSVSNIASRYYSMRVWLNPARMTGLGVTIADIRSAISEQNADAAAGMLGTQPIDGVSLFFPLMTGGRLKTVEEFENIIVRANPDSSMIYLKDIARIELGSSDYNKTSLFDGKEATILGVYLLPKANPVATARNIRRVLEENAKDFPAGLNYRIIYDYGQTIQSWLYQVGKGIVIAVIAALVVLSVLLRCKRVFLIFAFILPVIVVGSLGLFGIVGLNINMLSLLAVLFAVGFALDDLIQVFYQIQLCMKQEQLSIKEASLMAAKQKAPSILVTAFLLVSVLGVIGFMAGIPGKLYREFSYALAICIFVSALISVTIIPALFAFLLRKTDIETIASIKFGQSKFKRIWSCFTSKPLLPLMVWAILTFGCYGLLKILPTAFLPEEDQGYILAEVILPDGTAFERTSKVMDRAVDYFTQHPAVDHIISVKGISARVGTIDSRGHFVVMLKPWSVRRKGGYTADSMIQQARMHYAEYPESLIFLFNPPTIPGLGAGGGFVLMLQDRTGRNWEGLVELTRMFIDLCNQSPVIQDASTNMQPSIPQFNFIVDKEKAKVFDVSLKDVYGTCSTLLTSSHVGDFNLMNRIYRVKLQAESRFRRFPSDLSQYYVRSSGGQMVPIATLVELIPTSGPGAKRRYNMFDATTVLGTPAPGYSSGQAIQEAESILKEILPPGFGYQWSGVTNEEIIASKQIVPMLILSFIIIIVLLAGLYESWITPAAVLPVITIVLAGALVALLVTGSANGLYFQISMVALVTLAIKQASITVSDLKTQNTLESSLEEFADIVAEKRLLPVLLVNVTIIIGLIPFVLAQGDGAATRRIFTVGVLGGLIANTLLGITLIPAFAYYVFKLQKKWFSSKMKTKNPIKEAVG